MFRPCIDLHEGQVKQLIGATLTGNRAQLRTHYVSDRPASWYAELYKRDGLRGGHIIMLGPGNEESAREALAAYPGGLQIGGGMNPDSAPAYLDAGASHVIVTSWIFDGPRLEWDRLAQLSRRVGKNRLVIDLSCRRFGERYRVVTNRWQTVTEVELSAELFSGLRPYCAEFLIHAVEKEGLASGVDEALIAQLAAETALPTTYAGGARSLEDLEEVHHLGGGKVDLTIGSALDIFGGSGVHYADVVAFNRRLQAP